MFFGLKSFRSRIPSRQLMPLRRIFHIGLSPPGEKKLPAMPEAGSELELGFGAASPPAAPSGEFSARMLIVGAVEERKKVKCLHPPGRTGFYLDRRGSAPCKCLLYGVILPRRLRRSGAREGPSPDRFETDLQTCLIPIHFRLKWI